MILLDDKQVEALEARRIAEEQDQLNEPPPTYASLQSSPHLTSKVTNYVSIIRSESSVKETCIIDPSLYVPLFLRPSLQPGETEETRKNLRIETTHGQVRADITLASHTSQSSSPKTDKRISMYIKATHGGITAKIHGLSNRSPFVLQAQSVNGEVRLHVPRTFHGPVIVSHRHGSVRFSDAVSQRLTSFGNADNSLMCFLGDLSRWSDTGDGWAGDELIVDVKHGNVNIRYDDDEVGSSVKSRPTYLNRIFGF